MASRKQMTRFAAVFASGTMLSRVFGLVREMVLARFLGDASRDLFFFVFSFPNMLRDMLGEGASNAAFVPVLAEEREKGGQEAYARLIQSLMGAMLLVFGVITVVGVLCMPLLPSLMEFLRPLTGQEAKSAEELSAMVIFLRWCFPYFFFIGLTAFMMAPLFVAKHYSTPSWTPVLLNISLILCCWGLGSFFEEPAWAAIVGVWIGGIAQLACMYYALGRKTGVWYPNVSFKHPGVMKAGWLLLPVIAGQATGEVNKVVNMLFAKSLEDGTVTALFYANRLVQLPLSIFGMAIAVAILPSISKAASQGKDHEVRETLMHGLLQTTFLVLPAAAGLMVMGRPIISLLFENPNFNAKVVDWTYTALVCASLGLPAFALVKVSVQAFFAVQNTKTPVIIASLCMLLNILLNATLVGPFQLKGLAISSSISFTINFLLLYALLSARFGRLWDGEFLLSLGKILLATGLMAIVAYGLRYKMEPSWTDAHRLVQALMISIPILAAAGVYFVTGWFIRLPEVRQLFSVLGRRR